MFSDFESFDTSKTQEINFALGCREIEKAFNR